MGDTEHVCMPMEMMLQEKRGGGTAGEKSARTNRTGVMEQGHCRVMGRSRECGSGRLADVEVERWGSQQRRR